jgi:hypothetical protein
MAKKPTITTIASGYYSRQALNNNFTALRDALDNTVSRDGSTPNAMAADFDLNGNDLLNVKDTYTDNLFVGGIDLNASIAASNAASAAAGVSAGEAAVSADSAAASAVEAALAANSAATLLRNASLVSAGQTAFTLDYDLPLGLVFIDGVQQSFDAYSYTFPTLTFTGTVASGSVVDVLFSAGNAAYSLQTFETVTNLLDDTTFNYDNIGVGASFVTRKEGFSYEVAAAGATDQHVTTSGGVKLYILPAGGSYPGDAMGLAGDGSAGDGAKINTLIDALYAAGGGKVLMTSGNLYGIEENIHIRSYVEINLNKSTFIAAADNINIIGEDTPALAHQNFSLYDGTIDGNYLVRAFPDDDQRGNSIRCNRVSKSTFKNLRIQNSVFNAVSIYNVSNDNTFDNLIISDTGKAGTLPAIYTFNGMFFEAGCSRNRVSNVQINTTRQYGIWIGARDADQFDNQFVNVWIANTDGDGIRIGDDVTTNKSARHQFTNVNVRNSGSVGVRIYHAGGGSVREIVWTGGHIENCVDRGILCDSASFDCQIIGVQVRDGGDYGVRNTGTRNQFIGLSMSANAIADFSDAGTETVTIGAYGSDGLQGTFSPTVLTGGAAVGRTYSLAQGRYRVNGNQVSFQVRITLSAKGSSTGGFVVDLAPSGFVSSASAALTSVSVAASNLTFTGQIVATISANENKVRFYSMTTGGALATLTDTALAATTDLIVSGVFEI